MVTIDVERFEAFIFDLDGVITQTASIHARAWKQLFDEFLARRAAHTGAAFVPSISRPTTAATSMANRASRAC